MKLDDIRLDVIRGVLPKLPEIVTTFDVSKHPEMKAGHIGVIGERNYHACVGKVLSQRCADVRRLSEPGVSPAKWRNALTAGAS